MLTAISGRAYLDDNENGRFDVGEFGLAGQIVYLDYDGDAMHDAGLEPHATTRDDDPTTPGVDESGRYLLPGLSAGKHLVRAVGHAAVKQTSPVGNRLTATTIPLTSMPADSAPVDFDHDDHLDLAVATTEYVRILRNNGDGAFDVIPQEIADGNEYGLSSIIAHNFDGQHGADLVVANRVSRSLSVFYGDAVWFGGTRNLPLNCEPFDVIAGDWNGDDKLDLAAACSDQNVISLFYNNGSGEFGPAIPLGIPAKATALASGSFNQDAWSDLAVVSTDENNVSVLINQGNGFAAPVPYDTGRLPSAVVAADLDGDKDFDLAISNFADDNVTLLRDDDGSFSDAGKIDFVGDGPRSIAAADLEHDGDADLLVGNVKSQDLSILRNRRELEFDTAESYAAGVIPPSLTLSVTVADFNGDQVVDLAAANEAASRMTIMLNDIVPAGRVVQLAGDQDVDDQDFGFSLFLPGDTNADCVVNVQDLNAVRNHFGSSGDNVGGDANLDRRVDIMDLNLVRNNFGALQSCTQAEATPRPVDAPSGVGERRRAVVEDRPVRRAAPALIDFRAADVLFGRILEGASDMRRGKSPGRR